MPKVSVILLCLLLAAGGASAQTEYRLGVRVGGNWARTTVKGPTESTTGNATGSYRKSGLLGGQLGVVLEARHGDFALQPALLFSQKGTVIHESVVVRTDTGHELRREGRTTARYHWLELPLNVVYTLPGKLGLQLLAGPYVAVGVGGRASTSIDNFSTDPSQPVVVPTTIFVDQIAYGLPKATMGLGSLSIRGFASRRVDAGLNLGLGFRRDRLQLQASYGLGVVNLYYDEVVSYNSRSGYNEAAQLTGTYFFGE